MPFIHHTKVRMYDTDTAQILFFGNQYRFMNDAFEDMLADGGLKMDSIFSQLPYRFVVVHSEANYLKPVHVGNNIDVHTTVSHIGKSSFTIDYTLFSNNKCVGDGKTIHVVIDRNGQKIQIIPNTLLQLLKRYSRH